jgi:hypothetical protein
MKVIIKEGGRNWASPLLKIIPLPLLRGEGYRVRDL